MSRRGRGAHTGPSASEAQGRVSSPVLFAERLSSTGPSEAPLVPSPEETLTARLLGLGRKRRMCCPRRQAARRRALRCLRVFHATWDRGCNSTTGLIHEDMVCVTGWNGGYIYQGGGHRQWLKTSPNAPWFLLGRHQVTVVRVRRLCSRLWLLLARSPELSLCFLSRCLCTHPRTPSHARVPQRQ